MNHRNNFDLIRLLAACQVMYSHGSGWLKLRGVWEWAHTTIAIFPGVAIFFVISGFLISGSFIHSGKSLSGYAKSRALRIYPALWVNLSAILVLLAITGCLRSDAYMQTFVKWIAIAFPMGSDWIANYFTGPIFHKGFYPFFPSGVLWTIPIEMSFYALVPLIFANSIVNNKHVGLSIAVWGLGSFYVWTQWALNSYPYQIPKYLWFFMMGAAMQVYWPVLRRYIEGKALFWIAAFLTATWGWYLLTGELYNYRTAAVNNALLSVLLATSAISSAFTATPISKVLRGNDLSYGIYLWHMPVFCTFMGFGLVGSWWYAATAVPIVVLIAFLSWKIIEKPALALKSPHRATVGIETATAFELSTHGRKPSGDPGIVQ